MGIANIDKGKLRRFSVDLTAEAADVRRLTVRMADGYGTPASGVLAATLAAATAYTNIVSNGDQFITLQVINTAVVGNVSYAVVTGTLVAESTFSPIAKNEQVSFLPDVSGVLVVDITNTNAADIPFIRISCGGESVVIKAAWA